MLSRVIYRGEPGDREYFNGYRFTSNNIPIQVWATDQLRLFTPEEAEQVIKALGDGVKLAAFKGIIDAGGEPLLE